jgi:hypothetical protein
MADFHTTSLVLVNAAIKRRAATRMKAYLEQEQPQTTTVHNQPRALREPYDKVNRPPALR